MAHVGCGCISSRTNVENNKTDLLVASIAVDALSIAVLGFSFIWLYYFPTKSGKSGYACDKLSIGAPVVSKRVYKPFKSAICCNFTYPLVPLKGSRT